MNSKKQYSKEPYQRLPIEWDRIKFVPGELVVQFNGHMEEKQAEEIFRNLGCKSLRYSKTFDTYHLKIEDGKSVQDKVNLFNKDARVKWAEPNILLEQPKPIRKGERGNE